MSRSVLAALVVFTAVAAAQEDPLVVVSPEWSVSVRRPSASWSVVRDDDKLTLRRDDLGGAVAASLEFRWHVGAETALQLAEQEVTTYRGARTVERVESATGKLGADEAPGIDARVESAGVTYRMRRLHAVRDGVVVVYQGHAPADSFDDHAADLEAVAESVAFLPLSEEAAKSRRVIALASRCASRLPWARTWEEAATRARKEGKLVLAWVDANGGFQIGGLTRAEVFMDRDIAALVASRFVPIEYRVGMGAPFESHDVYGLSGSTFGRTVLCATPEGEVVAETSLIHPHWIDAFLVDAAAAHGRRPKRSRSALRGVAARAAAEAGLAERALDILDEDDGAESHLLRARVHLRRRAARSCREALSAAEKAGAGALDVGLEWCRLLLRTGHAAEARRRMERLHEQAGDGDRRAETGFWLARARYEAEDRDGAREAFLGCLDDAGSPFAWRAAAWVLALGVDHGGTALSIWPTSHLVEVLAPPVAEALPATAMTRIRAEAVAALLSCQGHDGSFDSLESYSASTLETPGQLSQAVDALALLALWPHRDRADVRDAVERGLDRLVAVEAMNRSEPREFAFMDYSVWRDPAWIWALATIVRDEPERAARLRPLIDSALSGLGESQKPAGGWGYYVTRKIGAGSSDQAMSFVTAFVLVALDEAERTGIEAPAAMKRRALDFLASLRHDNAAFEYMTSAGIAAAPPIAGAAGRGPICALALLRHGRAEVGDVVTMLDLFSRHSATLAAERHKGLMHTGADTQGSHYLHFDYLTAALAAAELPERDRAPHHAVILERVLETRLQGGAFLDNPIVGRAAGTAMGLLALALVAP